MTMADNVTIRIDADMLAARPDVLEATKHLVRLLGEPTVSNSQIDTSEALRQLHHICTGIDKDEIEDEDGWWETPTGAEFGAARLRDLERLVTRLAARITRQEDQ
jgi:hypothetical protein